ncbi:hypothetical protein [Actinobaculum suis]|uniref:hypothetical protein n=1 Tax=Actinobaculum suis TaxID=1657 RepID=UPI00114724EF|nr:hypothetical protein [Actinobaculum suis]
MSNPLEVEGSRWICPKNGCNNLSNIVLTTSLKYFVSAKTTLGQNLPEIGYKQENLSCCILPVAVWTLPVAVWTCPQSPQSRRQQKLPAGGKRRKFPLCKTC